MKTGTILFVEDDIDDRELLEMEVSRINPEVKSIFAENGLQALEVLSSLEKDSELPCLIVLDLNMPILDGKETFQRLRTDSRLKGVPVVIFTSSSNPNDRSMFNSLGVEFITKPDHFEKIRPIVSHMLNICSSRQASL